MDSGMAACLDAAERVIARYVAAMHECTERGDRDGVEEARARLRAMRMLIDEMLRGGVHDTDDSCASR